MNKLLFLNPKQKPTRHRAAVNPRKVIPRVHPDKFVGPYIMPNKISR